MNGDEAEEAAARLKTLAESKYRRSDIKSALSLAKGALSLCPDLDGATEMATAFKILRVAEEVTGGAPDMYKILQVEPFSHANTIKKQYKKLDLILHPHKNPSTASEEAFKHVAEAFRCLSDKTLRKEYDLKLRIALQSAAAGVEVFSTVCPECQLVHRFKKTHLRMKSTCPDCGNQFVPVEVSRSTSSARKPHRKIRVIEEVLARSANSASEVNGKKKEARRKSKRKINVFEEEMTLAEMKRRVQEQKNRPRKPKRPTKRPTKQNGLSKLVDPAVEDSDFYDFGRDRVERIFRKGQIWAIYDDEDGMPRHYGLIEEIVSKNPFEVKLNWLEGDLQHEETGFHRSCGEFRISPARTSINALNIFSHDVVDCERAAKEKYLIHPRKGSVWALYSERTLNSSPFSYDIAVFLTSYSESYGVSMAYLEKVGGFRAVFKRRETGCHAITWMERMEPERFSHQIPARIVSGGFWELDPASLPPELLVISHKH